jgi:hypothetical protein
MTPDHAATFLGLNSNQLAAWAQAVGSIGAIIAALIVVWLQPRAALKVRQRSILAIAEAGLARVQEIGGAFIHEDPFTISSTLSGVYHPTVIEGIVQALTDVPAHEIGSRDGVIALLSLRDQFTFLQKAIDTYIQPRNDPETAKELRSESDEFGRERLRALKPILAKNVRTQLAAIQHHYASLRQAIGGNAAKERNMKASIRWDLIAIVISIAATIFAGLQWWEAHELRRLANDSSVNVDVDTDPADNKLGVAVRNAGPGVATVKTVRYYVDGRLVGDINDAVDSANLDSNRLNEIELTDDAMAPGEKVWVLRFIAKKADKQRAADFFEKHLNVAVNYCTAGGRCAFACADDTGCPASKGP